MSSITETLKDSGVVNVGLEKKEEISQTSEPHNNSVETPERPGRKIGKRTKSTTPQSDVTLVSINFARPRTDDIFDTAL